MPITAHDRLPHEVEKMKYTVELKFYSAPAGFQARFQMVKFQDPTQGW
jgi:hypothetical protein